MIGPHIKLIEREITVSAAFTQFHKECGSPSSHLEGGTGYPHPVGLAVHRKISMRSWFTLCEKFSGTYRLKKVLGLSREANAGKTHSQTSHSYRLEALSNLETFLNIEQLASRRP